MNAASALTWWQWAMAGSVPALIVLLYFLKLRRQPVVVPSTYLWRRTMEDLHVNSIWQRLRRNLLMLLQLLLVALLLLALLNPGWQTTTHGTNRLIILVDNSASMQARDNEQRRLAAARTRALDLVQTMQPGDVGMLVTFADTARVVQTYTDSRRRLRQRIASIAPTSRSTNVVEALQAAAGLANPGFTRLEDDQAVDESLPAKLYLISDGGFPDVPEFSLGHLTPEYLQVGRDATRNLGIVAFSAQRNPDRNGRMQAFVSVGNFGPRRAQCNVELYLDDVSQDVVRLDIPAGEEAGWAFDLPELEIGVLRAEIDRNDPLDVDNVAWTVVNRPRKSRVLLLSRGNQPLQLALSTASAATLADVSRQSPDVVDDPQHRADAAAGRWDLIIYDDCAPVEMPAANTLFLGRLPPAGGWSAGPVTGPATIVNTDQVHPITQLVDMRPIVLAEVTVLTPPSGSDVLVDSALGPIVAVAPRSSYQDLVLGFPLFTQQQEQRIPNSIWPRRSSFPVFIYNALRFLGGQRTAAVGGVRPGQPLRLPVATPVKSVTVTYPDQRRATLRRYGTEPLVFTDTEQPGVYTVSAGKRVVHRFAVNLFDSVESNLRARTTISLGHEQVKARHSLQRSRRELWKWLVWAALAVLAVEWVIYHRRVAPST